MGSRKTKTVEQRGRPFFNAGYFLFCIAGSSPVLSSLFMANLFMASLLLGGCGSKVPPVAAAAAGQASAGAGISNPTVGVVTNDSMYVRVYVDPANPFPAQNYLLHMENLSPYTSPWSGKLFQIALPLMVRVIP